jgi:methylenetetrahydrofolate dehydrogenase (NADP+)/methenyltetrahydrofolate cyclohydrolase
MTDPKLLEGTRVAERIKVQLKQELSRLGATPRLRILYFNQPASLLFKLVQERAAIALGIVPGGQMLDWGSAAPEEVNRIIRRWNDEPDVNGIFVHQPMPPQIDPHVVSASIDPRKDIEGIHPQNMARRFFAKARIGSCTALAVMELIVEALRRSGGTLEGKEAVVVGHSEIVGRPVSMLLLDRFATTTVCHVATRNLEQHVSRADVVVVAVGKPKLIKGSWIKLGSIVIDVGINVEQGKVVGDVAFEEAHPRAAFITPVPGGVGPVTVMMVMKNTVEAFRLQQGGC